MALFGVDRSLNAMKLRIYHQLDELTALRGAWDQLLSAYGWSTTFSTWEWLSCWWRAFGKNSQLFALALFDEGSRLVGLAPFSVTSEHVMGGRPIRVLRLMGDGSGDSDNLDIPVSPGFEQIFSEMVIESLERHRNLWEMCQFNTLPAGSPVAIWLAACAADKRWTCREYESRCSAIALPENWERYTEKLSSEDRKNLVRYTERLKRRYSTSICRCSDEQQLPACLDALFRLHQERWRSAGEPGSFASADRRDFYHELSRCLLQRGWLELWVLELNQEIAAVQFAFRYRDTVFQLQEGYDHSRPSDRIGYVLRGEVLKRLISEGIRKYDFLGGEDAYKSRWAAEPGSYRSISLARPLTYGALLLQTSDLAMKSKEWLRSRLSSSGWSFLHRMDQPIRRKPTTKLNSGSQVG